MKPSSSVPRLLLTSLLSACLFLAFGCESSPSPGRGHRDMPPPQTPLEGKSALFNGAVEMRISLAPFFMSGPEGRGGRGGGGGGEGFRSRSRVAEEFGPPPGGGEMGASREGGGGGGMRGGGMAAPATHRLRVSFTNLTKDPITFDVYEVRSVLGVFGVRPNRLTLAGGQTTEIDPMRSAVGENFASLDVTVQVRHSGKTQNIPVSLTNAENPAPPPPPPPAH